MKQSKHKFTISTIATSMPTGGQYEEVSVGYAINCLADIITKLKYDNQVYIHIRKYSPWKAKVILWCPNKQIYEQIKLQFVTSKGNTFEWKG